MLSPGPSLTSLPTTPSREQELTAALERKDFTAALSACEDLEMLRAMGQNGATHTYGLHMLLYLLNGDWPNARFLYKRAPEPLKAAETDVAGLWLVTRSLLQSDYAGAFAGLNERAWSNETSELIEAVKESIRSRVVVLLAGSYTTVVADTLAPLLGLSAKNATAYVEARRWRSRGAVLVPPLASTDLSGDILQKIIRECGALETHVIHQTEMAKGPEREEKKTD